MGILSKAKKWAKDTIKDFKGYDKSKKNLAKLRYRKKYGKKFIEDDAGREWLFKEMRKIDKEIKG